MAKKAGQERFRTLSTSYYRGAHGVIIVYDISSRSSFAAMDKWIEEARNNANPDAVLYIVGLLARFFFYYPSITRQHYYRYLRQD